MKDWDEIIRQKLNQEDFPFEEEDWQKLDRRLPRRRRNFLPWSMAAGLALLLGLLWIYPGVRERNISQETVTGQGQDGQTEAPSPAHPSQGKNAPGEDSLNPEQKKPHSVKPDSQPETALSGAQPATSSKNRYNLGQARPGSPAQPATEPERSYGRKPKKMTKTSHLHGTERQEHLLTGERPETSHPLGTESQVNPRYGKIQETSPSDPVLGPDPSPQTEYVKSALGQAELRAMAPRLVHRSPALSLPDVPYFSREDTPARLPRRPRPVRSSLALVAAPDLSSVQGAGESRFSTNLGLLYTYALDKRWSATAGVLYARKNYASPYSFYKPDTPLNSNYPPTDVRAVCQVLAVPLALNYTAWQKNNHTLQLSAGASTYFMLREKYSMQYASNYTYDYEIKGENQHYFGVADLSLTYLRRINKQYQLGIRPFVQLPLQGIGYGNIPLQSQGLALIIGLNR